MCFVEVYITHYLHFMFYISLNELTICHLFENPGMLCFYHCRTHIQTLASSITELVEVLICPITLKAMKFVNCYDRHSMLGSSLLLAGRTQLATITL